MARKPRKTEDRYKFLPPFYRTGSSTTADGRGATNFARKAIALHRRQIEHLLDRCKRLMGRYCWALAGKKTTILEDGTKIETWINPYGLAPVIQSKVTLPEVVIEELEEIFIRGLISIPVSEECRDGFLSPTWINDVYQEPPTCSLSWNSCTADTDVSQPRRFAFAPAKDPDELEAGETLGTLDTVKRSPDYKDWSKYIDRDGPEYGKMDWISADVGTEGNPDYIVLSWKTFAARYGSIQPEAKDLFYRGDILCSLPNNLDDQPLTFLGAAVADFNEDLPFTAGKYLVAAVLELRSDGAVPGKSADSWIYKWLTERPHECPGDEISTHHGYYPIQFYVRPWLSSYQNDDLYDETTNANGWRRVGEINCHSYAPVTYVRAFARPRVFTGVFFEFEGDGAQIKCCWTTIDEWRNHTDDENVFHIVGYQTAGVTLKDVSELSSFQNAEQGSRTTKNGDLVTSDVSEDWDSLCCPGGGRDARCPDWAIDVDARFSNGSSVSYTNSQVTTYDDYVIACDWQEDGTLVLAKLALSYQNDGDVSSATCIASETLVREFICDPADPPPCIDGSYVGSASYVKTSTGFSDNGSYRLWNLVVTGDSGFTLQFWKTEKGRIDITTDTISETGENGQQCTFFNEDLDPPALDQADPTITDVGTRMSGNRYKSQFGKVFLGEGSFFRTSLIHLDIRFGSCMYTQGGYDHFDGGDTIDDDSYTHLGNSNIDIVKNVDRDGAYIEIGVFDKGQQTVLATAKSGLDIDEIDSYTTSVPPGVGTYQFLGTQCSEPDKDDTTTGSTTAVDYDIKDATGIKGFFEIDGYQTLPGAWVIDGVNTHWGACDEYGNMLVSKNVTILGYDTGGSFTTYFPADFGLDPYWSYLSDQDAEQYYGIDTTTDPRLGDIGLI